MTPTTFLAIVSAVFFGNVLTAGFIWAGWNITRLEREGLDRVPGAGRGYYIVLALVGLVGVAGLYLAVAD